MFRIERALLALGARPDRRGYEQTVLAVAVLLASEDEPGAQQLYARAARLCGCSSARVAAGVRDTVRCIWRQGRLTGGEPGGKAFVYGLAARLRLDGVRSVQGLPADAPAPGPGGRS